MTAHRVAELEGALLDAAVEMAELPAGVSSSRRPVPRKFSESWALGGPIIERERISVAFAENEWVAAYEEKDGASYFVFRNGGEHTTGPTPLIAAMRAYVASKFGDTVELT